MFPTLKVRVSGLRPKQFYAVLLQLTTFDDKRYRYVYHRWVSKKMGFCFQNCSDHMWEKIVLKVRKFQNENMKSSHCPKYEWKKLKNSALSFRAGIFKFFQLYFWQCDDFKYFHSEISWPLALISTHFGRAKISLLNILITDIYFEPK